VFVQKNKKDGLYLYLKNLGILLQIFGVIKMGEFEELKKEAKELRNEFRELRNEIKELKNTVKELKDKIKDFVRG